MVIYLIGSLRNPKVPEVAARLRRDGHDVFDDWFAAGPEADDFWRDYERGRGHSLPEALDGYAARHVFGFDRHHLDRCEAAVLLLPAGRSGHLELGYVIGAGKPGYILLEDDPERYDVMYAFAKGVYFNVEDLCLELTGSNVNGVEERGFLAPAHSGSSALSVRAVERCEDELPTAGTGSLGLVPRPRSAEAGDKGSADGCAVERDRPEGD